VLTDNNKAPLIIIFLFWAREHIFSSTEDGDSSCKFVICQVSSNLTVTAFNMQGVSMSGRNVQ
jgi:hypothetical protein